MKPVLALEYTCASTLSIRTEVAFGLKAKGAKEQLFGLVSRSLSERREKFSFTKNEIDRKSTRLNSSHTVISYAVFCLKKKKKKKQQNTKTIKTRNIT